MLDFWTKDHQYHLSGIFSHQSQHCPFCRRYLATSGEYLVHHGHFECWNVFPMQLGHGTVLGLAGSTLFLGAAI